MSAAALLFDLWQCGIQPRTDPLAQHLLLPANKLTSSQRQAMTECKADVLELLTAPLMYELMDAAMKACDHWQDGIGARGQMWEEVLATDKRKWSDLLAHFRSIYRQGGA